MHPYPHLYQVHASAVAEGVVDVVAAFVAGSPVHVVNPDALGGGGG